MNPSFDLVGLLSLVIGVLSTVFAFFFPEKPRQWVDSFKVWRKELPKERLVRRIARLERELFEIPRRHIRIMVQASTALVLGFMFFALSVLQGILGLHQILDNPDYVITAAVGLLLLLVGIMRLWLATPSAIRQHRERLVAKLNLTSAELPGHRRIVCRLLFPFVTNQANFDTGITIANLSGRMAGEAVSFGSVRLSFYGNVNGKLLATNEAFLNSGASVSSNLVSILLPGFQGYAIAECPFPASGFAHISDGFGAAARGSSSGYLARVLDADESKSSTQSVRSAS